jgi:iron complex transport system permease protein
MMARFTLILMIAVVAAFILSLSAGKVWIGPSDWLSDSVDGWIIAELRLPRAILGAAVGAILGLSGAVLQGYLRNPLADPTVVGVSSTAALGGVIAILQGLSPFPLAMITAGMSVIILMLMSGRGGGPLGFILGGMVLATLSGSLTAFLISITANPFATSEIIAWMMGALTDRGFEDVWRAVPLICVGAVFLASSARAIDALTLGEETARSLGINAQRQQWIIAIGIGFGVGAAVAVSGVVGFVGLIVPHLVRAIVGQRPSAILLPSTLLGAVLVLVADSLVRLTPGTNEMRLGIAMAVLGTPFFFMILTRLRTRSA